MKGESKKAILALEMVTFSGEKGIVGPLDFSIFQHQKKIVLIENKEDQLKFTRIIKGMEIPATGKIFKRGSDSTGWIIPDGIVCVVERERFFFRTVRGEIAFAADVAGAKNQKKANNLLPFILEYAGIENRMTTPIDHLNGFERALLSLACVFIMLPEVIVLLNPLAGFNTDQEAHYTSLFTLGRKLTRCASLQVVSRKEWAISPDGEDTLANVA
jgi:energy-coupling factor transporter ATP-binding protein EcfA2